jgi:hypothetical protein
MRRETAKTSLRGSALRRFVRHYFEMVVVMVVGMMALAPLWDWGFELAGWPEPRTFTEVHTLIMATNMTIAMSILMLVRGHSVASTAEMGAAMYVSFVVLYPPYWFGVLDAGGVMMIGHVLMFVVMLLVMLRRRDEYAGHHHGRAVPQPVAA